MKNNRSTKLFNQIYLPDSNKELEEDFGDLSYRFRLTGVPPNHALKLIKIDPKQSIAEIKKSVQRNYKLNPILGIQLIFKGKVLPDELKFGKIGIQFKKDIITVISTQGGGAIRLSNSMKMREVIKNEK